MKCKFILKNGEKCSAFARKGKEYCFSHDPESKEQKHAACLKGATAKQNGINGELKAIDINSPSDIIQLLILTIEELREGKMHHKVANTIAYLAQSIVKVFEIVHMNQKFDSEIKNVNQQLSEIRLLLNSKQNHNTTSTDGRKEN